MGLKKEFKKSSNAGKSVGLAKRDSRIGVKECQSARMVSKGRLQG